MNLEDLEIDLITNMARYSGIGSYSSELFRILSPAIPKLKLYSLCHKEGVGIIGSINISHFYASNLFQIPLVTRRNFKIIKESKRFNGENLHLLGSDYSLVSESNRAIATIHEYYYTVNDLYKLKSTIDIARELSYNYGELKLHRYIKKFQKIITPSHHSAKQVKEHIGIEPVVIHETVDENKFHAREKEFSRKMLRLPEDKIFLLNVSGEGPNKNLKTLQRLAEILPNNFKLIKIGSPIKSKNALNFNNVRDDMYPLFFTAADIYLNVSTNEGFNIPLMESLKSSLPVVSNRCATSTELLGDGGIYIENPYDVGEYLKILLFASDNATLKYYSDLSVSQASKFSDELARQKYLQVYSNVFQ